MAQIYIVLIKYVYTHVTNRRNGGIEGDADGDIEGDAIHNILAEL